MLPSSSVGRRKEVGHPPPWPGMCGYAPTGPVQNGQAPADVVGQQRRAGGVQAGGEPPGVGVFQTHLMIVFS